MNTEILDRAAIIRKRIDRLESGRNISKGHINDTFNFSSTDDFDIRVEGSVLRERTEALKTIRWYNINQLSEEIKQYQEQIGSPPTEELSEFYYDSFYDRIPHQKIYEYPDYSYPASLESYSPRSESGDKYKHNQCVESLVTEYKDLLILEFLSNSIEGDKTYFLPMKQAILFGF